MRGAGRVLSATMALLLLVLGSAGDADATKAIRPPHEALAVLARGVVWVNDADVLLEGFASGTSTLGSLGDAAWEGALASSADAAVVFADGRFVAVRPPMRLSPVAQLHPFRGGGCEDWVPGDAVGSEDFAVVGDALISSATCAGGPEVVGEPATRQPLLIRSLRGGRWRVLRWLAGTEPPLLSGEDAMLAVATQVSLARMRVTLVELPGGRVRSRFDAPDGYLSFASRDRMVLAVPPTRFGFVEASFPLPAAIGEKLVPGSLEARAYELELYSTGGRPLAALGSASALPLVSDMHIAAEEPGGDGSTVVVRNLRNGEVRRVVGFDAARGLLALAFRWPALAVAETTRAQVAQSALTCWNSEYGPASSPFLGIFDLARGEPFLAPPPSVPLVRPALGTCGPPPPIVFGDG
jgi:hypothetical protein